jgi:hypothetical protein
MQHEFVQALSVVRGEEEYCRRMFISSVFSLTVLSPLLRREAGKQNAGSEDLRNKTF